MLAAAAVVFFIVVVIAGICMRLPLFYTSEIR